MDLYDIFDEEESPEPRLEEEKPERRRAADAWVPPSIASEPDDSVDDGSSDSDEEPWVAPERSLVIDPMTGIPASGPEDATLPGAEKVARVFLGSLLPEAEILSVIEGDIGQQSNAEISTVSLPTETGETAKRKRQRKVGRSSKAEEAYRRYRAGLPRQGEPSDDKTEGAGGGEHAIVEVGDIGEGTEQETHRDQLWEEASEEEVLEEGESTGRSEPVDVDSLVAAYTDEQLAELHPDLVKEFALVEVRKAIILSMYDQHALDPATALQMLGRLYCVYDGALWALGGTSGKWYRQDNSGGWLEMVPPKPEVTPRTAAAARDASVKLPSAFVDAEHKYVKVLKAHVRGKIEPAETRRRLANLTVEHDGKTWALGARTGRWYTVDEDGLFTVQSPSEPSPDTEGGTGSETVAVEGHSSEGSVLLDTLERPVEAQHFDDDGLADSEDDVDSEQSEGHLSDDGDEAGIEDSAGDEDSAENVEDDTDDSFEGGDDDVEGAGVIDLEGFEFDPSGTNES